MIMVRYHARAYKIFVLVGFPYLEAVFAMNPMNFMKERTFKGTLFGNYSPCLDFPNLVELYLK